MTIIQKKKPLTLVLTLDKENRKILLGMKKRGFGANKYNGFGGKLEPGESVIQAAHRELEEEATIKALDMEKIGVNLFTFENHPVALEVHVFLVHQYTGEPSETEEMKPEWFRYDAIPFDHMWKDDRYWLPHAIEGKSFLGEFHFSEDQNDILSYNFSLTTEAPEEFDLSQSKLLKTSETPEAAPRLV